MADLISNVYAREIINARGIPTIETIVVLESGIKTKAASPAGLSVSDHEAIDLRDGDRQRYMGKGVQKAVSNVNEIISKALIGKDPRDQREIDELLISLDGTRNKRNLGGNAMISTSIAVARAGAYINRLPLYTYLGGENAVRLPIICPNLISGSRTAGNHLDFEDFLAVPYGFPTFKESVRAVVEMFHILNRNMIKRCKTVGQITALTPPDLKNEDVFDSLCEAIDQAGYTGKIGIAIDAATDLIYDEEEQCYHMDAGKMNREELVGYYEQLCKKYPMIFIEDGLHEDDYEGFELMTRRLPVPVIGDDLFATDMERLRNGAEKKAGNGIIIKANQAGTVTETLDVSKEAQRLNYIPIASTRSGETADEFQADLAVAEGARYMKTGCPFRGEMVTKWNRLMEIEDELGDRCQFGG